MTGADFTQEEATALREAAHAAPGATAQTVSLAASDRHARRRLPDVQRCMAVLQENVRVAMTQHLRTACVVDAQPLQLSGPMVMQDEAKTWLMAARILDAEGELVAALGVSPRLGFHLIELAYGAPNVPARTLPSRTRLTLVERETLWPAILGFAQDLARALALPRGGRTEPTGFPTELGDLPTGESGVVQAMGVTLGEHPVTLGVVVTPKGLEGLGVQHDQAQGNPLDAAAAMVQHVAAADVSVVANLGTTHLAVAELADLQVGQTLWLDKTPRDPVDVLVEGQHKFNAMPMQRAGAVGVQITSRTP